MVKWRLNRRFDDRHCRHLGRNSDESPRHDIPAHTLGNGGEAKRFGGRNEVLFCVVLLTRENFTELCRRESLQLYIAPTTGSKL